MIDESRRVIRDGKPNQYLYGKYANVPLTATQYLKMKREFPNDWEERVEMLSEHIEKTGKVYKDCLCAIRVRARMEKKNNL